MFERAGRREVYSVNAEVSDNSLSFSFGFRAYHAGKEQAARA